MTNPIIINFSKINEDFFAFHFGADVAALLNAMMGDFSIPVTIKGSREQISSFGKVLHKEKEFLQASQKYGLDNPATYQNKLQLNKAASQFERATGIPWPFK